MVISRMQLVLKGFVLQSKLFGRPSFEFNGETLRELGSMQALRFLLSRSAVCKMSNLCFSSGKLQLVVVKFPFQLLSVFFAFSFKLLPARSSLQVVPVTNGTRTVRRGLSLNLCVYSLSQQGLPALFSEHGFLKQFGSGDPLGRL